MAIETGETFFAFYLYTSEMSEQATKSLRPVSLLAEFLEQMETIQDPLMLFEQTCRFLPRLTETSFASLLMFELPSGHPVHKNIYGNDREPCHWPQLLFRQQIDEMVLQHGVVLTCDPQQGNGFWLLLDEADGRWQGCELHLPLFWDHDRLVLLSLGKKESGADFTAEELDVLRILSCQLARWSSVLPMTVKNRINSRSRWLPMRGKEAYAEIIGVSPAIREIKKIIGQIAATDASVLITGESGTGKELLARAIHRSSMRGEKPMVVMNCASIPETLVESELFGHEKGAFTGAICRRKGKFEFAHESTLFLDEIGDMSLAKAYAIQAGREIRVIVENDTLDDLATSILAGDIAARIEREMQYPGQIKVTVVRETRATEFAR